MITLPAINTEQMLFYFTTTIGSIVPFITTLTLITGGTLAGVGIYYLYQSAQEPPFLFKKEHFYQSITFIILGILFFYFSHSLYFAPLTVFKMTSLGNSSDLIAYSALSFIESKHEFHVLFTHGIKLFGIVVFLGGCGYLSQSPHRIGKGIAYIIGGILALNSVDTKILYPFG